MTRESRFGRERVTAPVEPLAAIWLAVPVMEVTPVLVTLPALYARPEEKVVVAVQTGRPFTEARTFPSLPAMASLESVLAAELYNKSPAVYAVCPVPPYIAPMEVVAETSPPLACNGPLRDPESVRAPAALKEEVAVLPK